MAKIYVPDPIRQSDHGKQKTSAMSWLVVRTMHSRYKWGLRNMEASESADAATFHIEAWHCFRKQLLVSATEYVIYEEIL